VRTGIDQDMEIDDNPQGGRSVLVVAECTPSEQWSRHIEHVARYSAERRAKPIDHADVGVSMGISRAAFDHSVAVAEGYTRYWRPLIISFGVVGFSVIGVLLVISSWASYRGTQILAVPSCSQRLLCQCWGRSSRCRLLGSSSEGFDRCLVGCVLYSLSETRPGSYPEDR
jgi:hypothetical protein